MKEIEFELKFKNLLKEEIENENLFDQYYEEFLNDIFSKIEISNIDEIKNNFSQEEIERYNLFINSVEKFYSICSKFYRVTYPISYQIENLIRYNMNMDYYCNSINFFTEINKLDKNFIFLDLINQIIDNYKNNLYESAFDSINNKSYLKEKAYLSDTLLINLYNNGKSLTAIDVEILNLLLDNDSYSVVTFVDDDVFCHLSNDKLIKILNNIRKIEFRNFSNQKIKYILNKLGLKITLENVIYDKFDFGIFYKEVEHITDEEFDYIISARKYRGIENYKNILENNNYIIKLVKASYYPIITKLDNNQLLEIISAS